MTYLKFSFGIFAVLAASRFIPHPPNFTSLMALTFYVPAILGVKFLPALLGAFILTDIVIGLHSTIIFTWGSVLIIGMISIYFKKNLLFRFLGAVGATLAFFIFTNFGVWTLGSYGYSLEGLINCYILALPFYGNTLISTLIFSIIIECIYKIYQLKYSNSVLVK